jgi:signal transduction histidine kinase
MTTPSDDRPPPEPAAPRARRWNVWTASFVAWTALAAFATVQSLLYRKVSGQPLPPARWYASVLFSLWSWAAMTPAMLWLGRRFPFRRQGWPRTAGLHALCALGFALVGTIAEHAVAPWIATRPETPFAARFLESLFDSLLSYIVAIAIGQAIEHHRLSTERTLRASALEAELARAQLLALQMQLRPHFLFNALHTIGSLIRTGEHQTALRTLAGLGDLLRALLRRENDAEVPVRAEVDFIELYLRIEQIRFQDRLRTRLSVDPSAMDALVPSLVLQPLVENAVRHGIEACEGGGELEIRIAREGASLRLEVTDSGAGPTSDAQGIGLGNTRARLLRLYGDEHELVLSRREGGGTRARISIPFRRAGAEAS